jgi:hypothetical protein
MAAPQISALPTPPNRANSPDTFSARGDAFLAALPTFQSEANAQADYVDAQVTAALAAGLADAAANASAATSAASSAQNSETNALNSEDGAATSYAGIQQIIYEAGLFKIYATYPLAEAALNGLAEGMFVKVLVDATQGNRTTYYQVDLTDDISLDLDFITPAYGLGYGYDRLVFVKAQDFNRVAAAPATSTSAGFQGDYFSDATYFYYCYAANLWRRTAGSTF